MKVLMISGDKSFKPGHPRFDLQASQVEKLEVVYWGKDSTKPELPKGEFDVVTSQDPFWRGWFARKVAKRLGAKFNVQVHTDLRAQSFAKHVLAQIILRHADTIRVVSQKVGEQVEKMGIKAPITLLPIFIDKDAIRNAPVVDLRQIYPQFEKIILVASRLEPEKNVELAINAMPAILKAHPKAGMVIAGDGSQMNELLELAKKLNLEDKVLFIGHRTDIFSLYKGVDLVINPSKYEGFGATIVEALTAGCAVVSTDVGVASQAGAFVVKGHKKDIAAKAIEVLAQGVRGELKLLLPPAFEWAQLWRDSLK